jgi:hypothetical protein
VILGLLGEARCVVCDWLVVWMKRGVRRECSCHLQLPGGSGGGCKGEDSIRKPKEERDRVPSIPRIYMAAWFFCQEAKAYKLRRSTQRRSLLFAGRPGKGTRAWGFLGVGI